MNKSNVYQLSKSKLTVNIKSNKNIEGIAHAQKLINIATLNCFPAIIIIFFNGILAGILFLASLIIGLIGWTKLVNNIVDSPIIRKLYIVLVYSCFLVFPVMLYLMAAIPTEIAIINRIDIFPLFTLFLFILGLQRLTVLNARASALLKENGYKISLFGTPIKAQ